MKVCESLGTDDKKIIKKYKIAEPDVENARECRI